MELLPLSDRVIIERIDDAPNQTPGGIIIPDQAKPKPIKGTVVAVGPGRLENGERAPIDAAIGDTVFYGRFSGSEFEYDGKTYLVMCESDIIAKLRQ